MSYIFALAEQQLKDAFSRPDIDVTGALSCKLIRGLLNHAMNQQVFVSQGLLLDFQQRLTAPTGFDDDKLPSTTAPQNRAQSTEEGTNDMNHSASPMGLASSQNGVINRHTSWGNLGKHHLRFG